MMSVFSSGKRKSVCVQGLGFVGSTMLTRLLLQEVNYIKKEFITYMDLKTKQRWDENCHFNEYGVFSKLQTKN